MAIMIPHLDVTLPKSLSTLVEERIRDAIVNAELDFGQALPEDGLGLSMGVSRTPMREALTRLQVQGLVTILPKRGTFVFKPTVADVDQLAAFRLLLETTGARLCIAGAREATLSALQAALSLMVETRKLGDQRAYARADTAFHDCFFAHCGNDYLANAFRTISYKVAALRAHLTVPKTEEQEKSFKEHQRIVVLVRRGQAEDVCQLLDQHIMRAASAYRAVLEKTPASK